MEITRKLEIQEEGMLPSAFVHWKLVMSLLCQRREQVSTSGSEHTGTHPEQ